jgi:hypothetical protein
MDRQNRLKVGKDNELINFPLKCKQESLVNVKPLNLSVIIESDA